MSVKTYLPLIAQLSILKVAQELNSLLQVYGYQGWVQFLGQTSQALQLNLIAALFKDALREKSDFSSSEFKAAGLV